MFNLAKILVFLAALLFASSNADRRVARGKSRLALRQVPTADGPFTGPRTVTTVTTTNTPGGTRVETCIITFTPIQQGGVDLVKEDRSCTSTFTPNIGISSSIESPSPTPTEVTVAPSTSVSSVFITSTRFITSETASPTDLSSSLLSSSVASSTDVPATSTSAITTLPTSSALPTTAIVSSSTAILSSSSVVSTASVTLSTSALAPSSTQRAVEVIGTTFTSRGSTTTASATTSASTSSAPAVVVVSTGVVSSGAPIPTQDGAARDGNPPPAGSSSTSASAIASTTGSGTAPVGTAAQATESAAAIQLPGQKMEVLPIGLGVFAGISAIALIVVGYVTWERRKHRNAFRARKNLAASAAPLGYGGTDMAQRQA